MKWIAFGMVLMLVFGCVGEEAPSQPVQPQEPAQQEPAEHLVVGEGEGSVVTEGQGPPEVEATEYTSTPGSDLYVYFFNVGYGDKQGDAILVKKGDLDILVDGGPTEMERDLVTMMLEKGVDDLELVVSTHEDQEHTGGLKYVSTRFRVGEVWRPEEGSAEYGAYLDSLGAEKVTIVGKGDHVEMNGISITVLNPIKGEDRFFDANNDGIVLKIEDRGLCVLLTGDILGAQQQVAIDCGPCQVVQWPNHGISEGLTEMNWFMDQTKPEVIVISGSSRDWTNSRQSLMGAAHLGGIRNITVLENYDGRYVEVFWDGSAYTAAVGR